MNGVRIVVRQSGDAVGPACLQLAYTQHAHCTHTHTLEDCNGSLTPPFRGPLIYCRLHLQVRVSSVAAKSGQLSGIACCGNYHGKLSSIQASAEQVRRMPVGRGGGTACTALSWASRAGTSLLVRGHALLPRSGPHAAPPQLPLCHAVLRFIYRQYATAKVFS